MKTIKLLFVAEVFFKTCMVLTGLVFISLIVLFIHSVISPESYNKVILNFDERGVRLTHNKDTPLPPASYAEFKEGSNKNIYFSKLSFGSKLSILLRSLFGAAIVLLVLKELINFLNSAKRYSSFFNNNYIYFKWIGKYLAIALVFNLIINSGMHIIMMFPDGMVQDYRQNFDLYYLFSLGSMIILSFVASLVFKEGERLRSENELTV